MQFEKQYWGSIAASLSFKGAASNIGSPIDVLAHKLFELPPGD